MKTTQTLLIIALSVSLSAKGNAATRTEAVATGAAMGMVGGAASGAMIAQRMRGEAAIEASIVAAILGGLAAYLIHREVEKKSARVRRETLLNLKGYGMGPRDLEIKEDVTWPWGGKKRKQSKSSEEVSL